MVLAGERNLLTAAFGWLLAVPRFLSAQHACCSRVRKAALATPPTGRYVKHLADRFHGLAVFDLIRDCRHNASAVLCAFDLLEINGEDIRAQPIEDRKRRLAGLLRLPHEGIAINEHFGGDGAIIFKHACTLGCEGIVSKRMGSSYRAGRSPHWLKLKNPAAPAVKREAEEDWGEKRWGRGRY